MEPCQIQHGGALQGFWGSGYFNEDSERAPPNLLRAVENKKLLSTAGKLKLLSTADKAGFNLAKVGQKPSSGLTCQAAACGMHVSAIQTLCHGLIGAFMLRVSYLAAMRFGL